MDQPIKEAVAQLEAEHAILQHGPDILLEYAKGDLTREIQINADKEHALTNGLATIRRNLKALIENSLQKVNNGSQIADSTAKAFSAIVGVTVAEEPS